jgi:uncharacterized membrane protein
MVTLLTRLKNEKIILAQFFTSLLLLIVTIAFCSLIKGPPEEKGVMSASVSISLIIFVTTILFHRKEGVERVLLAILGSFMAGFAAALAGSRLAFDPNIRNYFLASLVLSLGLSLSCILYVMPENPNLEKIKLESAMIWICATALAALVNFIIIYWLPIYIRNP